MKNYQIAVLRGDGIGPEIVNEAVKVLDKTASVFGFGVTYTPHCWAAVPLMKPAYLCRRRR